MQTLGILYSASCLDWSQSVKTSSCQENIFIQNFKLIFYKKSFLPAGWVTKVALTEDNSIERSRELERDNHPGLLAGHVQARDLRHVGGLLPLLAERLNLGAAYLQRENERLGVSRPDPGT